MTTSKPWLWSTAIFAAALTVWTPARAGAGEGPRFVVQAGKTEARRCFEAAAEGETGLGAVDLCTLAIDVSARRDRRRDATASTVNRGVVRYNRGDYAAAIADFTEALDGGRTVPVAVLVNRGLAYEAWRPGDAHAEAMARLDYQSALARRPNHEVARRRLGELDKPFLERAPVGRTLVAGGSVLTRRA